MLGVMRALPFVTRSRSGRTLLISHKNCCSFEKLSGEDAFRSHTLQKRFESIVEGSPCGRHAVPCSADDGAFRIQFAVEPITDRLKNGMVTARGDKLGKRRLPECVK